MVVPRHPVKTLTVCLAAGARLGGDRPHFAQEETEARRLAGCMVSGGLARLTASPPCQRLHRCGPPRSRPRDKDVSARGLLWGQEASCRTAGMHRKEGRQPTRDISALWAARLNTTEILCEPVQTRPRAVGRGAGVLIHQYCQKHVLRRGVNFLAPCPATRPAARESPGAQTRGCQDPVKWSGGSSEYRHSPLHSDGTTRQNRSCPAGAPCWRRGRQQALCTHFPEVQAEPWALPSKTNAERTMRWHSPDPSPSGPGGI